VLEASDGNLYGTTAGYINLGGGAEKSGTLYQLMPAGGVTFFKIFNNGTDGFGPITALIDGGDGYIYGAASSGGPTPSGDFGGTVFKEPLQGAALSARAFVSTSGDDANPCSLAFPCRTFARALARVVSGGEVVALKSGGYGPFVIAKAVSILVPPGIYAGITASSGDAITVFAGDLDAVSVKGLTLNGLGGVNGIHF